MKKVLAFFLFSIKILLIAIALVSVFLISIKLIAPEILDSLFNNNVQEVVGAILFALILFSFLDAILLGIVIKYSRWTGLKLVVSLIITLYGLQTFIGMIDAFAFLSPLGVHLGSGSMPSIDVPSNIILYSFLIGLPIAFIIIPFSVMLFRKIKNGNSDRALISMNKRNWVIKILAGIVIYELLYYGFGYYIAWQHEAVRDYYQGVDYGSFLAQMKHIITTTPFAIPFQAFRAIMWILFVYPIISMFDTKPLIGALMTALFLSVPWIHIFLIMPNLVPMEVGQIHFIEVSSSNFIFGLLLYWIFHRQHDSVKDLFSLNRKLS